MLAPLPSAHSLLEQLLRDDLLHFWRPRVAGVEGHSIERDGYRVDFDHRGQWSGLCPQTAVAQCRTLWFFSRLSRSPYSAEVDKVLASRGFEYFENNLWDQDFGGVFWEVDSGRPSRSEKHLYAQAFALFALTEYLKVSGCPRARQRVQQLRELIECCRDPEAPGYLEARSREWNLLGEDVRTPMGATGREKTINAHLHLLESYIDYPSASLTELLQLLESWQGGDRFDRGWRRLDKIPCLGHLLEFCWLRSRALLALGKPAWDANSEAIYLRACAGYDHWRGGFLEVPFSPWRAWQGKVWWVQAEGLLASLWVSLHLPNYSKMFRGTLRWIFGHQRDPHYLEWHAQSDQPNGFKGGPWKTPYHIGRCLLEGLDLLSRYEVRQ